MAHITKSTQFKEKYSSKKKRPEITLINSYIIHVGQTYLHFNHLFLDRWEVTNEQMAHHIDVIECWWSIHFSYKIDTFPNQFDVYIDTWHSANHTHKVNEWISSNAELSVHLHSILSDPRTQTSTPANGEYHSIKIIFEPM